MTKVILGISSFFGLIATAATLLLMLAITLDIAARTISGASIPGVFELGETVLVAAIFLGLAYAGSTNGHIAVDLVTERLPHKVSRWVVAFAWLASSVFLAWILWATLARALESSASNESRMGLIAWPLYPARWIIVIGLAAMLLVAITNVIRLISGKEVLGFEPFHVEVTNTQTLEAAVDERKDISSLTAANEPVINVHHDEPRKDSTHG